MALVITTDRIWPKSNIHIWIQKGKSMICGKRELGSQIYKVSILKVIIL